MMGGKIALSLIVDEEETFLDWVLVDLDPSIYMSSLVACKWPTCGLRRDCYSRRASSKSNASYPRR